MISIPPTLSKQRKVRDSRALLAYKEKNTDKLELVIGIPFVVKASPGGLKNPETLAYEAALSYSYALREYGLEVTLSAAPVSALAIGDTTGEAFLKCLSSASAVSTPGAYVWPGIIQGPISSKEELKSLFFHSSAQATRLFSVSCLRLEALLESVSVQAKLAPPTAIWNSASAARLGYAKIVLDSLLKKGGRLTARRNSSDVVVLQNGEPVFSFNFPEETNKDLQALFQKIGGL